MACLICCIHYAITNDWFEYFILFQPIQLKVKVKWSYYRPGVAQRVDRDIALLFHDCGTRVVSRMPWPHFTPGKDLVPILQEAGWAPGLVWMGGKSRPHRDWILDRPARSQSLYRLSYQPSLYNYHIRNICKCGNNKIKQITLKPYIAFKVLCTKVLYWTNNTVRANSGYK